MRKTAGILAAVAIAASALIAAPANADTVTITSGGSSFSAGIMSTCAANYTDAKVTYTSSASGTGRTNFANGTFDFAGSDGTFAATDSKPAGTAYVPVLGGPIAIIYNVDGVNNLRLDAPTIAGIFLGKITKWNDTALAKLNPGVKLPAATITPEYRNAKSGTNGNFRATWLLTAASAGRLTRPGPPQPVQLPQLVTVALPRQTLLQTPRQPQIASVM
jgi:phosphate transport system substrate-binding protein